MPRTIAALFDSRADAEGAFHALLEAGVAGHQSALLACREPASSELAPRRTLSPDHDDVRRALRELRLPAPDTAEFEEAVRHGGCLLSARVDAAAAARAVEIIEAFNPVDLDRPAADRRRSDVGTGPGAPLGAGLTAGAGPGLSQTASLPGLARTTSAPPIGGRRSSAVTTPARAPRRPARALPRTAPARRASTSSPIAATSTEAAGCGSTSAPRSHCARGAGASPECADSRGQRGRAWCSGRAR
jgi:hypothetical protein